MKSSPLSNWRTANPSEASKRPVDLSTSGSSSTRQTISASDFSTGVIHKLRLRDRLIFKVRHIQKRQTSPYVPTGYWTLVLCHHTREHREMLRRAFKSWPD